MHQQSWGSSGSPSYHVLYAYCSIRTSFHCLCCCFHFYCCFSVIACVGTCTGTLFISILFGDLLFMTISHLMPLDAAIVTWPLEPLQHFPHFPSPFSTYSTTFSILVWVLFFLCFAFHRSTYFCCMAFRVTSAASMIIRVGDYVEKKYFLCKI